MQFKLVRTKIHRQGAKKPQPEIYLVDAVTCTEAETKFHKYISSHSFSDLEVPTISPQKATAIINEQKDADPQIWFKATGVILEKVEKYSKRKGMIISIKKHREILFIKESSMELARIEAEKHFEENSIGDEFDYEFGKIEDSKIMDLIR